MLSKARSLKKKKLALSICHPPSTEGPLSSITCCHPPPRGRSLLSRMRDLSLAFEFLTLALATRRVRSPTPTFVLAALPVTR